MSAARTLDAVVERVAVQPAAKQKVESELKEDENHEYDENHVPSVHLCSVGRVVTVVTVARVHNWVDAFEALRRARTGALSEPAWAALCVGSFSLTLRTLFVSLAHAHSARPPLHTRVHLISTATFAKFSVSRH